MTYVGSRKMYLDPDLVPPLAGFRLYGNLGVFHHAFSMTSVCILETAYCFWSFYPGLRIRIRIQSGQWIRIQEGKNDPQK